MIDKEFTISFDALPADAGRLAQALEDHLRSRTPDVRSRVTKDRSDTLDFGSTLVLVFGTPVAIALANAVRDFLRQYSSARITIKENGELIAENLESKDAARIAEAFTGRRRS